MVAAKVGPRPATARCDRARDVLVHLHVDDPRPARQRQRGDIRVRRRRELPRGVGHRGRSTAERRAPRGSSVRADPRHVLDAITPVLSGRRPHDGQRGDARSPTRGRAGGREELPLPFAQRRRSHALRSAGVDVVNMANNHALDYGRPACRTRSPRIASSKIARRPASATTPTPRRTGPYRTTIKGQRIAILERQRLARARR